MFKSTFSKYMIAFVAIILISFLMLSAIITSMIRTYTTEAKETQLYSTTNVISSHLENSKIENLESPVFWGSVSYIVTPLINNEKDLDIIVCASDGTILLSSVGAISNEKDGIRYPIASSDMGTVDLSVFEASEIEGEIIAPFHRGNLGGYLKYNSIACAADVVTDGQLRGYVIALFSTESEDQFIQITRRAVLNSSAWVMLAAVIAVYFITERIIHPLKSMTKAVKEFGKGDFKTRVTVYGSDEISELAVAFNNMAESLDSLEKMRNSFLASVSHDLKTPMTTIAGFIDGIMSGAIPPEKQEYYLGIISSEIHRLSRLVSQILDVSRLESGDRKMNFTDFDVAEVARIILISFENKIDEKKLEVEFNSDGDEMMVNADKDAIHQVIYNLCHNAIKFANEGGKFVINITSLDSKRIKVSVFDEGQTVGKEDLKLIFERFYKTDASRGLDKTGVGLGLYISKTIIDAHEQEIHAVSVEDRGAEFWFTLKKSK